MYWTARILLLALLGPSSTAQKPIQPRFRPTVNAAMALGWSAHHHLVPRLACMPVEMTKTTLRSTISVSNGILRDCIASELV
jgi:hypothetical protein